jgi:uncharacterized membrane protein
MSMSNKNIKWLYEELPGLISKGILTQETAGEIRKYYGEPEERNWLRIMLAIFGTLGSILIGSGIILIFAKNWDTLSIPARTVLSFAPLIISQLIGIYVIFKKSDSMAWKEGISALITLSVGAAISLIGQTYNISGDRTVFTIAWMLLIVPLVYIFDAFTPSLFYLIGITFWAGFEQSEGGNALLYWGLLAILVPYVAKAFGSIDKNRSVLLLWALSLNLCVSIGIVLEKVLPGLWIVIYSSFFTILFLLEKTYHSRSDSLDRMPFNVVGTIGILVVSTLLTFKGFWDHIGWLNYRHEARFNDLAGIIDYILVALLLSGAVYLFLRNLKTKNVFIHIFGSAAILSALCYLAGSLTQDVFIPVILYNAYVFVLGISAIVDGIRNKHMGITNGGMLIISILIIVRFFDTDMSFLVKGLSFIAVGVGFIISNAVLIKKQKEVISDEKSS